MKIRNGPLHLVEVADCIVQTCEALAHAHGTGIVHRDIKASNLFEHRPIGSDPVVKVLDFGISKMFASPTMEVERTLTRTRDGGFLGSPPYMSPAHVKDPRNVDGRADLWSLGVVAYRLLSTRFPFPGETTGEVLAQILELRPKRLRALGIEVPDSVDRVIDRCLQRDRDDRYPDAGALAQAFAPFTSSRFQGYAKRVPEIVANAIVPSPAETSHTTARRKIPPRAAHRDGVPPPPVEDEAQATLSRSTQSRRRRSVPSSTRAPWEKPTPVTPTPGTIPTPAPATGQRHRRVPSSRPSRVAARGERGDASGAAPPRRRSRRRGADHRLRFFQASCCSGGAGLRAHTSLHRTSAHRAGECGGFDRGTVAAGHDGAGRQRVGGALGAASDAAPIEVGAAPSATANTKPLRNPGGRRVAPPRPAPAPQPAASALKKQELEDEIRTGE